MGVLAISTLHAATGEPLAPIPERLRIDREARRDLVESVRRAMPGANAVIGLRAAHGLAATRSHPDRVKALHAYLCAESDGTVPDMPNLPDPWAARNHDTRPTRSRKGRVSFKRDRTGKARVIGDRREPCGGFVWGSPPSDDCAAVANILAGNDLVALAPSYRFGADSLTVTRIADKRYREHGLPALIGYEGKAMASVIPGDASSRCSVAVQRTDLFGGLVGCSVADFVALRAEYVTDTQSQHRVTRFPARLKLRKLSPRKSDPSTVAYVKRDGKPGYRFVPTVETPRLATTCDAVRTDGLGYERCLVQVTRYVTPTDRIVTRFPVEQIVSYPDRHVGYWQRGEWRSRTIPGRVVTFTREGLATIAPEHMWLGHDHTPRGQLASEARREASERVKARTIGTVDAPMSLEGWSTLFDNVNRDERVIVTYPDGTVRTITRSAKGVYSTPRGDGSGKAWQSRTSEGLALKLI